MVVLWGRGELGLTEGDTTGGEEVKKGLPKRKTVHFPGDSADLDPGLDQLFGGSVASARNAC